MNTCKKLTQHHNSLLYLLVLLFLLAPFRSASQQFPSKFLSIEDGLPQNLYRVVQDEKGYMWVLSEEGIARYNGSDFQFTGIQDGLPDNDVYNLVPDKLGRNWLINNLNYFAYTRAGSVKNFDLKVRRRMFVIAKSTSSTDLLSSGIVYRFHEDDSMETLNYNEYLHQFINPKSTIDTSLDYESILRKDTLGNFILRYLAKNTHMTIEHMQDFYTKMNSFDKLAHDLLVDSLINSTSHQSVFQEAVFNKSLQFFTEGYHFEFDYDFNLLSKTPIKNPRNRLIKTVLKDRNGDYWLISKDGIFIVDKNFITNDIQWLPLTQNINVLGIKKYKNSFLLRSSDNNIYRYADLGSNTITLDTLYAKPKTESEQNLTQIELTEDRLFYVYPKKKLNYIDLPQETKGQKKLLENDPLISSITGVIKRLSFPNDSILLYASKAEVGQIDFKNNKKEILHKGFTNTMASQDGTYYIGALDSLFIYREGRPTDKLSIAKINRVYGISANECLVTTKLQESLLCTGEACNTIDILEQKKVQDVFLSEGYYWIVYDKGFIKTSFESTGDFVFIKDYRLAEILKVNQVNDLIIEGDNAIVATDKGLFKFNYKTYKLIADTFPTWIDKIVTSKRSINYSSSIELPYDERNITIHCSALSYKDVSPVKYTYLMNGIDDDGTISQNPQIRYTNLSPGLYNFEVFATNEFGSASIPVKLQVKILKPWWQTWLFYIAMVLLVGLVFYLFTVRRINQIREKSRLEQKFAELELNALQSQMNPHFVFNAMSSMQNLIQQKDFVRSDSYLAKFSRLMRMYLESSMQKYIAIKDELDIVETFFILEKLRFQDKISLELDNTLSVDLLQTKIPSSLIQPFVENAIEHGLFHKDKAGVVYLRLYEEKESIVIEIEDDGVGRKKAKEINAGLVKPPSRAIGIIDDKIKAIKKMDNYNIEYTIIDLYDTLSKAKGTKVVIRIN